MKKDLLKIIERIQRKKAVGIFYNVDKENTALIVNKLLDENLAVHVRGKFASDKMTLKFRLGNLFKIKKFDYSMLPAAIENKMLLISEADFIKPTYSDVLDNLSKNKVPTLLIVNTNAGIEKVRKLKCFMSILTIEYDFSMN